MKTSAIVSSVLLLLDAVAAWQVDSRCPDPPNKKRRLEEGNDENYPEDFSFDDTAPELPTSDVTPYPFAAATTPALRGRDLATAPNVFALKMYWERGFCWQEEYDLHRKWCWECKGDTCQENKGLWWQKCNGGDKKQHFSYIESNDGEGRFKWAYGDLCLQRVSRVNYDLKRCSNNSNQVIAGFRSDGEPFELYPQRERDLCINQHHHPKAGEIVENTKCKTARKWVTNLMELQSVNDLNADNNDPNNARLRSPQCTNNKPCERCQGDCDKDSHCKYDLVCYQRRGLTKYEPVPGCGGDPRPGRDYCIIPGVLPEDNIFQQNQLVTDPGDSSGGSSKSYQTPVRDCSSDQPCGQCEGDCDKNSDCKDNLQCFQKNGAANIPGCTGRETSKTDFCYDPNM